MSNQDLLSMIGSGDGGRMKLDQLEENRSGCGGLTGLTMMVGQTRLNVEPAPVDRCDEVTFVYNPNPGVNMSLNKYQHKKSIFLCSDFDILSNFTNHVIKNTLNHYEL
jgi:hypothetical protein